MDVDFSLPFEKKINANLPNKVAYLAVREEFVGLKGRAVDGKGPDAHSIIV